MAGAFSRTSPYKYYFDLYSYCILFEISLKISQNVHKMTIIFLKLEKIFQYMREMLPLPDFHVTTKSHAPKKLRKFAATIFHTY